MRLWFAGLALLCAWACTEERTGGARGVVTVDPPALDFGSHPSLATVTLHLTVTNDGGGDLTVERLTVVGDARGAFSFGERPGVLAPGESATVDVTYKAPEAEGPDGASLKIDSDAENAARLQVPLSGSSAGCPAPGKICGGACVDTATSKTDCGGCGVACAGNGTCQAGRCVCPGTCASFGKDCGDVPDGCGGTLHCGTCAGPNSCGGAGVPNVCGCTGEPVADLCQRLGADCDSVTGTDNCGTSRTVSCGSCAAPKSCGGGGAAHVCGCTSESEASLCARLGKDCDTLTATDNCGVARTVSCGSCAAPKTCAARGTANVCECLPESDPAFCARLGKDCDSVTANDNCGASRTATCGGSCAAPKTCGGGGVPNVCGCTGETDAALCAAKSAECGTVSATDQCGVTRTATCAGCTLPKTCGALSPNRCGCVAETDAAFCTRIGRSCGVVTANDNCGAPRTVSCGTNCWWQAASLKHGVRYPCLAAVAGKVYVTSEQGYLEAYDPATNTWADKAPLPVPRGLAGAAEANGKLYVVGGDAATTRVDEYDPATDTWTPTTPMPTGRFYAAVGSLNGLIYAAGGQKTCCTPVATLEVFDPVAKTWAAKASLPTAQDNTGGAGFGGLFYVAGGWAGPGNNSNGLVYAYDPATNTWSTRAPLPQPRQHAGVAAGPGLYVTGGWFGYSSGTGDYAPRDNDLYDAANDRWLSKALIPTAHYNTRSAFLNGVLYVIGSDTANNPSARVDAYYP